MKKVMISVTTLTGGGAERVVSVWANQLVSVGYDVSLLLYGRSENEYSIDNSVKIYTVADTYADYKQLGYFERLKRMRSLVKKVSPEVVINFLPRMQIWMMMATFGLKMRRIETVRVSPWVYDKINAGERYLWKFCFNLADATIVQTAEQAEYFNKKVQRNCVVIPNPVSKQNVDNPKEVYSDKQVNFVAAGRITEQKNYPLMINAFKIAKAKCPDLKLSIYGTGEDSYIAKIQQIIDENALSEDVKLMGRTTDMLTAFRGADAFLMTSDYEGMPNALLEAMATGLPCISTNCRTGPRDMIDDGENGFLVKVGDAESVAKAIIKVADMKKNEASNMGQSAREKILKLCSEKNSLECLISIIEA